MSSEKEDGHHYREATTKHVNETIQRKTSTQTGKLKHWEEEEATGADRQEEDATRADRQTD